ncbi:hypothetical protein [Paraliomyxa miuraensis]|uniref:hypothetical protein n=1 Tax=Paraliomyxa miuraensis TaxID=376150 RepID=UPI00224DEB69|nr:hypothetical protein [Paraliomyxa miuraensis]MCX4243188.1 hypothetical protein [Paraliomyxa miuraensis]
MMILESYHGPLARHHADGTRMWSVTVDGIIGDLAVDVAGNTYIVGRSDVSEAAVPWVASWDDTGASRWSVLGTWFGFYGSAAIDANRLVTAGRTEQQNTPQTRGLLVQYDHDGGLQWSQKLSSLLSIGPIVLVGDEIAVLGVGLDWYRQRILLRLDGQGAVRWSTDVSIVNGADDGARGFLGDGDGGTWIYGQREQGPWAIHHDENGNVLEELDCLAATAGSIWQMVVEPDGSLVAAILLSDEAPPIGEITPWLVWIDEGTVTAGARLGPETARLRTFALAWWPDGGLAVGVKEYDPDELRVLVIDP